MGDVELLRGYTRAELWATLAALEAVVDAAWAVVGVMLGWLAGVVLGAVLMLAAAVVLSWRERR